MRARAAVTSVVASIGILVVGWQIGAGTAARTTATLPAAPTTTGNGGGSAPTPGATASPGATPTTAAPATPSTDGTWAGSAVNTPFGQVQVQVTIAGGSITDVTALHLTDADGRSVQISNRAAPILRQEVLASQSASVSNVSGATYTTQGYLRSLQSALDQAGF